MNDSEWTDQLYAAWQSGSLKPVCAGDVPDADLAMAYRVQGAFIERCAATGSVVGFKGALTTPKSRQPFSASEAVIGVLLDAMQLTGGPVAAGSFNRGIIETEIGFIVGKPVTQQIQRDEVLTYIATALPMIEFGDVGFSRAPGLLDLIAGNAAAARFLAGEHAATEGINDVRVTLSRDGEVLHEGTAQDAMGDQLAAATWLINRSLALGYAVQPGQFLMTGSLGAIAPLSPGYHVADYGNFGRIEFEVTE